MTPQHIPTLEAIVRPHKDESGRSTKLLAFAELTIGGAFVIKSIRILAHTHELDDSDPFVVFPAEKGKGETDDRWYDIAHPCTAEARAAAVETILAAYARAAEAKP